MSSLGRTVKTNIILYSTDNMGRDHYITYNDGGFWKDNIKQVRLKPDFPRNKYYNFHSLIHPAASFNYHSDGTGRDSYVVHYNAGLVKEFNPLAKRQVLSQYLRNPDGYIHKQMYISESERKRQKYINGIQRKVVHRLYNDCLEKFRQKMKRPRLFSCKGVPPPVNRPLSTTGTKACLRRPFSPDVLCPNQSKLPKPLSGKKNKKVPDIIIDNDNNNDFDYKSNYNMYVDGGMKLPKGKKGLCYTTNNSKQNIHYPNSNSYCFDNNYDNLFTQENFNNIRYDDYFYYPEINTQGNPNFNKNYLKKSNNCNLNNCSYFNSKTKTQKRIKNNQLPNNFKPFMVENIEYDEQYKY